MVSVMQYGRRGNAYFQFATALAYGKRHNQNVILPEDSPYKLSGLVYGSRNETKNFSHYREPAHSYNEIPYFENVLLDGYFQTERYFSDYRDYILECFSFPKHYNKGICSIHVRRGDYLLPHHLDKHPVITPVYICGAIEEIIERTNIFKFHVYSDDIKWCKTFFGNDILFYDLDIQFSEGINDADDMYSMAQCEHHIISNSSFSWWSAWACGNKNKIVIAPKTWFGPGNSNLSDRDLCPESWIRL